MKEKNQLLARISKALGGAQASDVSESDAYMTLQTEYASFKETAEELRVAMEAEVEELKSTLAAALEEINGLKEFAEAAEAAKVEAAAKAEELRLATRKEKLTAVAGTVKAEALMAVAGSLDDAAFEAIVSALKTSLDAETNSTMFKESGVTGGDADLKNLPEPESAEMKILKDKYKNVGK